MDKSVVILANGSFPVHEIPAGMLRSAVRIVCCDGAAASLIDSGIEPVAIVGDCDSLGEAITVKYGSIIFRDPGQDTNDLTKSVNWCLQRGYNEITILGATGKREDHTLGNISLLCDYARDASVKMVTDTGIFYPLLKSGRFTTRPGQQVSIFSLDQGCEISSAGLKYPLEAMKLTSWWQASLNEATGNSVDIIFREGRVIVFLSFR